MKLKHPHHPRPDDAQQRQDVPVRICYPIDTLRPVDLSAARKMRAGAQQIKSVQVKPRRALCVDVPAGHFVRFTSIGGPQVGDLNIWNTQDLNERFFSGKTRALYGTHVSTGDQMWSNLPFMRPLATITEDTLDWYGYDSDGGSVHDVIGTRCDPYTGRLLAGNNYHYCCHSNLTRALADHFGLPLAQAEPHVHNVMNLFMLTGFTHDTHQYFMKASPVRAGDYMEMQANIDITVGLSACPGGDCGDEHSSHVAQCYPLSITVYAPNEVDLNGYKQARVNPYDCSHGR